MNCIGDLYRARCLCLLWIGMNPIVLMFQSDECAVCYQHYWDQAGSMSYNWTPFILYDPDLERDYEEKYVDRHGSFMTRLGLSEEWQFDIDGQMELSNRLIELGIL